MFDAVVDFDEVIRDPGQTGLFQKVYDSGDNLYPNDPRRHAMGEAVDLALLQ